MRTEPSISTDSVDLHQETELSTGSYDSQLLADYRQRYGLSVDPFVDDPHFPFYTGAQRRLILDQLLHLSQFSKNLLLVLGAYGVGKTRMAQALIDSLDDADDICFLEGQVNSDIDSLLNDVFEQFELENADEFSVFVQRTPEQDGLAIIIIDNAHHLADVTLKEIITLIYASEDTRSHLVLFGEAHLLNRLERLDLPDVVVSDFFLEKFSLTETVDYLNFRMEMADYLGPEIFTETKVDPWWRQSQGQLLVLHELAQEKLLASVSSTQRTVRSGLPIPHIIGASVLGAALIFGFMYWGGGAQEDSSRLGNSSNVGLVELPKSNSQVETAIPQTSRSQVAVISSQAPVLALQQASSEISPIKVTTSPSAASVATLIASTETSMASNSASAVNDPQTSSVVVQSVVPLAQTNTLSQGSLKSSIKSTSVSSQKKAVAQQGSAKALEKTPVLNNPMSKASLGAGGYGDQEKQILSWSDSEFTLQLVGLSSEKAVREFIAGQPNKKDLLVFRSKRQGKDWFVVVTGRYPSPAKAREALQLLPEPQKKAQPWPRLIRDIKAEIR